MDKIIDLFTKPYIELSILDQLLFLIIVVAGFFIIGFVYLTVKEIIYEIRKKHKWNIEFM